MSVLNNSNSMLAGMSLAFFVALSSGCASINSGLQSGEIPQGTYIAENGMQFNVMQLNSYTLPVYNNYQVHVTSENSYNPSNINELLRYSPGEDYKLAKGDVLTINLVSYPQIPKSEVGYPIDQQGYIQFPLIGRIKANGFTLPEFTLRLRNHLERYLKYPDPQVHVLKYRSSKFYIDGAVNKSGEFVIDDRPVSLLTAISMAGGVSSEGDSNNIVLYRNGNQYLLGLKTLKDLGYSPNNIYLTNGDSIHVNKRDRNNVFVLGEFGSIKPVEIPEQGLTLTQLLSQVQGLNSNTADAAKVFIVRDYGDSSVTEIYHANLKSITNLALANRFNMQPQDIVYVDPTGLTRWNRFLRSILPSTSAFRQLSTF